MEAYEPFVSLGLALAAGFLIGIERQQSAPDPSAGGEGFLGGARTHPLFALVGAVAMLLARVHGVTVLLAAFAAVMTFLAISYSADVRKGDRGLTSEAAFLLSFLLGALALSEGVIAPISRKIFVVSSIAVVATLLLSIKPVLHSLIQQSTKDDIFALLKFLIVAVVVLPLLPDQTFGPLEVLNPRHIGFMVVLIAGIGFVGYLASRLLGAGRGLAVTGFVGGLASSTAVTLSMSERAKAEPSLAASCALAVVLASSMMFARVVVAASAVNRDLVPLLVVPMAAMAAGGVGAMLVMFLRAPRVAGAAAEVRFTNPFELTSALKFAALYTVVLVGAKAATQYLGTGGTYLAGLLAGSTDVDTVTLSMSQLSASGQVPREVAATTIILGAFSNTLVKAGLAVVIGGWAFGRKVLAAFAAMIAAGAAALAAVLLI
jgi:uncharacterized membrane protein (DUF4010 family)